ncbi:alpha-amylase family glycosyl hydrolase [Isoptericola sp. AK164]|uniref:alpha-amylase family glycosyl hydrolase n=1 Tax=Isoptericola sp. AK164 TaxID=3024246 RepID=UPI0024185AAA|nr:alpha-amylase family glycosyl hydrolase [Isoptericola sp. AK164]
MTDDDGARPAEPGWVAHAMWWHVYPLGFVGAPVRPAEGADGTAVVHRLGRIEAWLDHVVALGLNGLLLGPVFASSTHGYDTVDHLRVDPRLGDEADLQRLVDAAHARGVRVLLDGVFHHVGREHPAVRALEAEGPGSPAAALFRVDRDAVDPATWRPGDPVPVAVFEGHDQLVALDHGSPAVEDLVVEAMTYWLDRGVDGWRLDAAYAVPPAFWARVLPRVRERHPEAWFTGEVIHGDLPGIVAASTVDSVTQYELWQGIWHAIADQNLFELAHALGRHAQFLRTFVPSTFVGNHDVTRIADAVGDRHVPHALAVLCTVAGTPSFYAGDELGLHGVKEERLGGDDAVRPELAERPPGPQDLSAEAAAVLAVTRELVALRRRRPWLRTAVTDVVQVANPTIVLRTARDADAVVTVLHLGDDEVTVPAAGSRQVLAGTGALEGDAVRVPAHGWTVLGS